MNPRPEPLKIEILERMKKTSMGIEAKYDALYGRPPMTYDEVKIRTDWSYEDYQYYLEQYEAYVRAIPTGEGDEWPVHYDEDGSYLGNPTTVGEVRRRLGKAQRTNTAKGDARGMSGYAPMIRKMAQKETITFTDGDEKVQFEIEEKGKKMTWIGVAEWGENTLSVNIQRVYEKGYLIETTGRLTTSYSSQNRTNTEHGDHTPDKWRTGEVLTAFVKDMRENPDEKSKDMSGLIP